MACRVAPGTPAVRRHRMCNQLCGFWRSPAPAAALDALELDSIRFRLAYGALVPILRESPERDKLAKLFNQLFWDFGRAAILYR